MSVLRDISHGHDFPLNAGSTTIGRAPECDIVLSVPSVSGRHALILKTGDGYTVADLGSSNGTFVNGVRVSRATRLNAGDQIDLCGVVLTYFERPPSTLRSPAFTLRPPSTPTPAVLQSVAGGDSRPAVSSEQKLRAVLEITRNLATSLALDDVLPKLLESLLSIFPQADRAFALLCESPAGPLIPRAIRTRNPFDAGQVTMSRTVLDYVVRSSQAVLSADAAHDERFDSSESLRGQQIRSIMCVPLVSTAGTILGAIQVDSKALRNSFKIDDLEVLNCAATQATHAVELARLHEVQRDLEAATQIQQSFLPDRPPSLSGLDFFDHYAAARHVGGDYYDYIPLPGNRLAVAVGDVAGKGVPAALLMARLAAAARFWLATEPNLALAVRHLNAAMMRACGDDRFITFVVGVIDLGSFETTWVNAGHLPPLLRRGSHVEGLGDDQVGIPLGVFDRPYEEAHLSLKPGDALFLYTDGVLEARNPKGELYGPERVHRALEVPGDVSSLGAALLADVVRFTGGRPFGDDVTLVGLGRP